MKFITVISKKIPVGNAINVASHLMAGLIATAPASVKDALAVINYGNEHHHHFASKWPHIILKAKNSNKIATLVETAQEQGLHFVTFTSTMIEGSWQEQLERTQKTADEDMEYYGVSVFVEDNQLDQHTSKFSLYT